MALYEYHCKTCERNFEMRRPMKEADAPMRCPECESDDITRKLSLFISLTKNDAGTMAAGGGCGCGGACSCGGHHLN